MKSPEASGPSGNSFVARTLRLPAWFPLVRVQDSDKSQSLLSPRSGFFQRASAAFRAISRRLSGDSFLALARPPFAAPNLANATA